jgi:hypothetical protein
MLTRQTRHLGLSLVSMTLSAHAGSCRGRAHWTGGPPALVDLAQPHQPGHDGAEREHGLPVCGQHPDPTQAAQTIHHRRPGRGGGQLSDGRIQPVAACLGGQHRRVGLIEGDSEASLGELLLLGAEPPLVRLGPGGTLQAQPMTQQQLGQPMANPQQIRAASSARLGTRTAGNSPMWASRARRSASRRSVLTRSPGGRSSLDGATTTHREGVLRTRDRNQAEHLDTRVLRDVSSRRDAP